MTRSITLNYELLEGHVHFREGKRMESVVPLTARQFGKAIVMPNTSPFILTVDDAKKYREKILAAVPSGVNFTPLITLYLQETTSPKTIQAAKKSGVIFGMKMYPRGQTTNSHGGVVDVRNIVDQLKIMEEVDLPLLIHGESADENIDVFDREKDFYSSAFDWITKTFPKLRISCEHITKASTAQKIERASKHLRLGATITPQHLLVDRNYMLGGNLRPHAFCKPILKRKEDREYLLGCATSGNPRFFLGTDSAPHPQSGEPYKSKENDCGCAGCFTAHAAIELYAEAFDSVSRLQRLEDFASKFGSEFYELKRSRIYTTLKEEKWSAPKNYHFGDNAVVPFRQEEPLKWKML